MQEKLEKDLPSVFNWGGIYPLRAPDKAEARPALPSEMVIF